MNRDESACARCWRMLPDEQLFEPPDEYAIGLVCLRCYFATTEELPPWGDERSGYCGESR